ncbi:hypothetical protein [Chryseobacterium sp. c4a]|uniref:hypothetical protein n=1 Tax=Chryseobacterium sp. c4a TaxID=1573582 RepID=UPI0013591C3D|nr:hypothetical protein [Chryseobacterium sp. c4a]
MKFIYFCSLFIILLSCNSSNEEIHAELEKFDNSLDSLISVKTYNEPNILIFEADTLKNNPKIIEETCYQIIENDSIKIDANCHIYEFKNNDLVLNSSENVLGRKFVIKHIYFSNNIDNKLIERLRKREAKSDTIYSGNVKKYDHRGRLIKFVESGVWDEIENGVKKNKEIRRVEIYKYNNDQTITTWRKDYFNKQYNIDSLKQTKITTFTNSKDNTLSQDPKEYLYKRDKFGNWIEKRRDIKENPEVYYRKYTY